MRKTTLLILLFSVTKASFSQEVVTGLRVNMVVENAWQKNDLRKGVNASDTLDLPFIDDFSAPGVLPNSEKWSDSYVFINNTFSEKQRTSGIATFDALDNSGKLYESAGLTVSEADKLTSLPINLNYPSSDDIHFSFFYEPGGLGDKPEAGDSLSLAFWAPAEAKWYSVWKAPESSKARFTPVIIRIDNSRFLKKGFRFKFTGHVSLSAAITDPSMAGSSDNWNVDYVKLGRFRSAADTSVADVAFTLPLRSSLKTFEAMPWKHFRQVFLSEMGPYINIKYRNNDAIIRNVTRTFEIKDVYTGTVAHSFSAGATNVNPLEDVSYNAGLIYTFNTTGTDSALFRVKSILTTDAFDNKSNDTLLYYQRFGRYFAFDDGSAEGGYGINGLGSRNAMVAYRYKSFILDTLRAVMISFNDSYLNSNQRSFDLMVWDDTDGVPSTIIYQGEELIAKPGSVQNGFVTYVLTDPVAVFGDFFIGWKQRSETFLNAGFDVNTPHKGRQFYYLNGNWNSSQAAGSIMIRPVFGPPINTVGIDPPGEIQSKTELWPNPADQIIRVRQTGLTGRNDFITITDLSGRERIRIQYTEEISTSSLQPGIYFIRIFSGKKLISTSRFIISR